ncbi:uncharacterized protein LOC129035254 isoform X2 [Pongo pygmaeus]|uniref:uncharacterized protein LOC129035254 isoform X2 n=1 Tax=Pongo pygmaeus TaxID=9600 RepID=UPI0023E20795|nr:uncharacterized protein LOC129035254 isoform X2 [Pongo pygmaeus]XP_054341489.1 uncharacterized protein LOC129035254 isoform X2 [Pongo pygmaeus]
MSRGTHQHRSTAACWQAVDQRKNAEFVRGGQRRVRPPYLTPGENHLPSGSPVCRELLPLNKTFHSFFKPSCDPILPVHQVLVKMYTWQLTVKSYEGLKHKVCIKGQNSHKPAQIQKEGTEMEPLHGRKDWGSLTIMAEGEEEQVTS